MKVQPSQEQQDEGGIRPRDWLWKFWFLVPIYPYRRRRTLRREIVKDTIWAFEQVQGILYVVVPIRMTLVKLATGGLLVYAPIAPTPECLRLLQELIAQHGDVRYIVLPTVSGLEHKVFVGPFARCFPQAQVYVAPGQWSFPLNLPLTWLGLPSRRTHILSPESDQVPFAAEFDYAILGPLNLGLGGFGEVALFHRHSQTLLLTDAVVAVPEEPPAIIQLDPFPLLFHARDGVTDQIADNEATRRKGWQRVVLFAFYFRPSALEVVELGQSIRNAVKALDRSRKAYWGWFPFQWKEGWERSFEALRGQGRLFVAPILQQLILNRAPQETLEWANRVARWSFQQIIPCHLDAPIVADPKQFRQAFSFLEKSGGQLSNSGYPLPEEDFELLREVDEALHRRGIVPPPQERI
jgi:hypothetical protein